MCTGSWSPCPKRCLLFLPALFRSSIFRLILINQHVTGCCNLADGLGKAWPGAFIQAVLLLSSLHSPVSGSLEPTIHRMVPAGDFGPSWSLSQPRFCLLGKGRLQEPWKAMSNWQPGVSNSLFLKDQIKICLHFLLVQPLLQNL